MEIEEAEDATSTQQDAKGPKPQEKMPDLQGVWRDHAVWLKMQETNATANGKQSDTETPCEDAGGGEQPEDNNNPTIGDVKAVSEAATLACWLAG